MPHLNKKLPSVSREKLYEEVWSEPMTKVATKYKVSGSYLARICTRLNVPRPSRGYWAMLAVGRKMARVPLPKAQPGDELEWVRDGQAKVEQFPLPEVTQEQKKTRPRRISIPDRHPILKSAKELIMEGKEADNGLMKPRKHIMVDILTSKETVDRALDVANELFLSFERRGYSVTLEPYGQRFRRYAVDEREQRGRARQYSDLWGPSRSTLVFIGTVAFGLTIFEMTENVEMQYQDGKYTRISDLPTKKNRSHSYSWTTTRDLPSGRLCVQVYSPYPRAPWIRQWREEKTGDFPRKLSGIIKELEAETVTIVRLVEEGERKAEIERQEWEEQKRKQQREEAERLRRKAGEDSHAELTEIIEAWSKMKAIERFFADLEQQAVDLQPATHAIIQERLKLAREMIGCTDAIQWFAEWKTPEERVKEEQEAQKRWRKQMFGEQGADDE